MTQGTRSLDRGEHGRLVRRDPLTASPLPTAVGHPSGAPGRPSGSPPVEKRDESGTVVARRVRERRVDDPDFVACDAACGGAAVVARPIRDARSRLRVLDLPRRVANALSD